MLQLEEFEQLYQLALRAPIQAADAEKVGPLLVKVKAALTAGRRQALLEQAKAELEHHLKLDQEEKERPKTPLAG